jgi:hypothetical protein
MVFKSKRNLERIANREKIELANLTLYRKINTFGQKPVSFASLVNLPIYESKANASKFGKVAI